MKLGIEDGERLRAALIERLDEAAGDWQQQEARALQQATVRIDPDGTLRIGGWLVEVSSGKLALTARLHTGRHLVQRIAHPERGEDGGWRIGPFSEQVVHRRRR